MHCMRCRKESTECHSPDPDASSGPPAPSTWGYTLPSKDAKTNACPPRPGMVTVQVRRNGIVRVEWFDKAKLLAAVHAPAVPNATVPPPPPSKTILCVPPAPGTTHPWPADSNCAPVADWTATIIENATAAAQAALAAAAPVDIAPSPPEPGTEVEEPDKTPIRAWFNGLVDEVYQKSYLDPPPPPAEKEDVPAELGSFTGRPEEDEGAPEISPEDCYGPPSLGCQVPPAASDMRV